MSKAKTKNNYGKFLLLWAGEFISAIGGFLQAFSPTDTIEGFS